MSETETKKTRLLSNLRGGYLRYIGILLLILGLAFLLITFKPLILAYIDYFFTPARADTKVELSTATNEPTKTIQKDTEVVFVDNEFGIYIPKIKTNSKVIANVDPFNESTYDSALEKGIAHAKGTSFPNQHGNVFLFAHSAVNFYEQRKYNVYFYLLNELKNGDEIFVSYKNQIYKYKVLETKLVWPSETKYMEKYMEEDTLTLMSCWPAGANWKRTIVAAVRNY